jgi:putative FmdB family regulatory protein
MPVYDYICQDCRQSFDKVLSLKEHESNEVTCPKCGSKNVAQEAAVFLAVTGRKS